METLIKTMKDFDISVFGYVTEETINFIKKHLITPQNF
jgi:hypothetical protein